MVVYHLKSRLFKAFVQLNFRDFMMSFRPDGEA
jgi:hypothetical protein